MAYTPPNPYFNNYFSTEEQDLISDLYAESINIHGLNVYYIPRNIITENDTYREAVVTRYDTTYTTECYLDSVDSYEGEGMFMSKFGVEVRDQLQFSFSQKKFKNDVGNTLNIKRPRAGDLLYFPLDKNLFTIMNSNQRSVFFQLGELYRHQVTCELFEYSNEVFDTGMPDIDDVYNNLSVLEDYDEPMPDIDDSILNIADEPAMNKHIQEETSSDFVPSEENKNPFGEL